MPDLVQAVGRALRMEPGEGKVASLVVPVLLGPGETADNMLTSRAFGGLVKPLAAGARRQDRGEPCGATGPEPLQARQQGRRRGERVGSGEIS
ncbi:hypothetical protein ACFQLX_08380 [Streptomyces polyrhachis]|uniref:Helicase C-terminal domain-containing protein n=1 Tax=Streptomyces polyrhachis TaxID=1282885 RepID=A0ABW2GC66_9ACTN